MEITGFVDNVTSSLFDPHVLAGALAMTLGFLSGGVARIVELLDRDRSTSRPDRRAAPTVQGR